MKMTSVFRLLLVDDHRLFLQSIELLFSTFEGVGVVGKVSTGKDAVAFVSQMPVDMVVLDLQMPEQSGIETLLQLRSLQPMLKVMILTMIQDIEAVQEVFQAGADGYLLKTADREDLLKATETIRKGGKYLDESLRKQWIDAQNRSETVSLESHEPLSPREVEVARLIAQAYSSNEISEKLSVSINTVEAHRKSLFRKLKIKNVAGLMRFLLRHGMFQ